MYLQTSLGQAQLPSRSGASCLQDEYPLKFIERSNLSAGLVWKTLNEFNYRKTELRTWHKTWIRHTFVPAIIRSWQSSTPIRTILLTGHTDEVGEASDNYQMGLARAQAVKIYLQEQIRARNPDLLMKITIEVLSSGECWPQIPGGKRERRNRRVEIVATPEVMTAPTTAPSPVPAQQPIRSTYLPTNIKSSKNSGYLAESPFRLQGLSATEVIQYQDLLTTKDRPTLGQIPTQPEVRRRITWLVLAAELRTLLERRLRSDDTAGIQDRRSRIIQLFESLMARPWDAHELYTRLFFLPNDPLAKLFHYRLATATRDRLRQILLNILRQTGEGTL